MGFRVSFYFFALFRCTPAAATGFFLTDTLCMSSEPFGQVSNGFKRGFGPSELKLWLQTDDAAGVVARWF